MNHDIRNNPAAPSAAVPPPVRTPGQPEDFQPLGQPISAWTIIENLLKQPGRIVFELTRGEHARLAGLQLAIAAVCLLGYGLTAGMFSWGRQIWAAPVKIMLGLFLSAVICSPSLVIFACLSGSSAKLQEILGILCGTLCLTSLLLLGFGPVSWIFAQSTDSVYFMGALHLVFWGIALRYGLGYLLRAFTLLGSRHAAHMALWSVVFILVVLQMSTTLRPILGTSERFLQPEKKFFLAHWAECAEGKRPPVLKPEIRNLKPD